MVAIDARSRVGHHAGVISSRVLGALALIALGAWSCTPKQPAATSGPAPSASAAPTGKAVAVVEGSILVKECPAKLDPKQARKTLDMLAGDCTSVPGGSARFLATLMPGGRIDIAAPDGSDEGTIPICVLKNKLRHRLLIKHSCTFEVQIEQSSARTAAH